MACACVRQVDAEVVIQEIWNAKKLYEQEKQAPVHLQDFIYTHLVRYHCYHRAYPQIPLLLSCASHAQQSIAQSCIRHSIGVTEVLSCASCAQPSIAPPCMRHTVGMAELLSLCILCTLCTGSALYLAHNQSPQDCYQCVSCAQLSTCRALYMADNQIIVLPSMCVSDAQPQTCPALHAACAATSLVG